ncbi:L-lactate permease [Puia dinghuensis]|uniref:L-lactate permease n=1 Tax=Puia dinghuensis TaxID=1792502 RepID=A0A8J2UGD3_9BACT|nr:lactate permease LctP family transporter [Puia dinghuensis]GGB13170.1 lactate permease [Puia dinghuensis]
MVWNQVIDPFHNLLASAGVAVIPVLVIFWALVLRKMKGYQASLLAIVAALIIAILVYRMPVGLALLSIGNGALYGLFPICWIILPAVFLFNCAVHSGQFGIIRQFMASITPDRRIQALLIAFSFGSFLEGTAGFGAPVAITAAMLTGLGFNPLYAAGLCLIANTAPVAFGSIGIPITVAHQVTGLPEQALSAIIGRTLPFLSALLPFYLVTLMAGFRQAREVAPAALVSGLSFAIIQFLTANYLGPALPDVLAGIGSIISLLVLLRWWRPRTIWHFPEEPAAVQETGSLPYNRLLWAMTPFILLTIMIIIWGLPPVKNWLTARGTLQFAIPGLHNVIREHNGSLRPHIFVLNYGSAAGTAVLLAALFALPLSGMTLKQGAQVFAATLRQLRFPILTIAVVLAFAYLMNDSGITQTIAGVLAGTGILFPFFSPLLGWLGVFITGSDTSSNALFGKLQASTATSIGVDPLVTVGANASGGVIGKMISPQSIAVAAAAGQLVGKESDLFRFTVRHSFILLCIICCIVLAQAYLFKWMIPIYTHS